MPPSGSKDVAGGARPASRPLPDLAAEPEASDFETLLAEILPAAYALARSLTRDAAAAEDLLQEAALAALKGFGSFAPGTHFKAWFYRILTNCHFYQHRRRQRRPQEAELDDGNLDLYLFHRTAEIGLHRTDGDPAARFLEKMTGDEVRRAVATLPGEYRVVVSLFFLEEMSYEEIAAIASCPVGTVRSRLHRGRKILQKELWSIAREAGIVRRLAGDGRSS